MKRPNDLLIYYGYLNSFNSGIHGWNNEKVSQDLARYGCIVIGDGIQDATHPDYSNTKTILLRVKEINPDIKLCGYVSLFQSTELFKYKVAQWKVLNLDMIFIDEMGYDYGDESTNGREVCVEKVGFVHSCGMGVIANAWNPDHILGTVNDPSYPNSIYNPDNIVTHLHSDDIYLLESHAIDSSGNYESRSLWSSRAEKARSYDIFLAAVSVIPDANTNGQAMFDFVYASGLMHDIDYIGTSDIGYGATNSGTKMWSRPDVSRIPEREFLIIASDNEKYFRFYDGSTIEVDFKSGLESSAITHN